MHKMWLQKGKEIDSTQCPWQTFGERKVKIAREGCVALENFLRNSEALK